MDESKEIRWRKIGGGSLRYIRGRIIKPNEVFVARPEEVPLAFRKHVIALEDIPEIVRTPVQPFTVRQRDDDTDTEEEGEYTPQERSTAGWWDVVNVSSGKIINEKGLRKEAAIQLAEELNK